MMPVREYSVNTGGVLALPLDAAVRLVHMRSGDAALLYLYILQKGGLFSESTAVRALGFDQKRLDRALSELLKAGILGAGEEAIERKAEPQLKDELPVYSAVDLADGIDGDPAFRHLVDETQRRLGKMLSQADLSSLFGIYDRLGLPAGVVSLLITYCVGEARRKYGEGRMPTMRQIEREAFIWEQKGIRSVEQAEDYLIDLEKYRSETMKIMRALQINSRAPSASEEKYIQEWLRMGFDAEAIYRAYDITVLKTGGLKWGYLNSILKSWHSKGLHTLEQIERGDVPPQRNAAKASVKQAKPGEYEKKTIEWLMNYKPGGKQEK